MKWILASVLLVGCQTQFTGDPHIDPQTCQRRCAASQLRMSGIVYMGEYSSACICEVVPPAGAPSAPSGAPGGASAAAGAAAGVVMQMRRANAAAASMNAGR